MVYSIATFSIEVIVYRSISNNVYANLALEDWIFKNVDLKYRRILLLWRNRPCVSSILNNDLHNVDYLTYKLVAAQCINESISYCIVLN